MKKFSLQETFEKFQGNPSADTRKELAKQVCGEFNAGDFTGQEKNIVKEILDFLSRDVEKNIRIILADTLKENSDLPHSVALRLANDIEEISIPVLEFSTVLTDDDLIEIINSTQASGKLQAIARREEVSEAVSDRLVETHNETVVETLVKNTGARISEETTEKIVRNFNGSENVLSTLVKRGGLSTAIAEKMISLVSSNLQKTLVAQYGVDPLVAKSTIADSREKATLGMISVHSSELSVTELVNHLATHGKLTHSIVLRALCRADMEFFEAGMAKLAGIPMSNARKLIYQGNNNGFAALFRAASMPSTILEATQSLLMLIKESKEKYEKGADGYASYLLEKIVENGYDSTVPNMQYIMTLISSSTARSTTRNHPGTPTLQ